MTQLLPYISECVVVKSVPDITEGILPDKSAVFEYSFKQVSSGDSAAYIAVFVGKFTVVIAVNIAQTFLALFETAFLRVFEYGILLAVYLGIAGLYTAGEGITGEGLEDCVSASELLTVIGCDGDILGLLDTVHREGTYTEGNV